VEEDICEYFWESCAGLREPRYSEKFCGKCHISLIDRRCKVKAGVVCPVVMR